jgi:nucleotide-binding universal stress UspA family protein
MSGPGFRKLLVPVNGHPEEALALAGAMSLAASFGSHVAALFAHMDPFEEVAQAGIDGAGFGIGSFVDQARKSTNHARDRARAMTESAALQAGVPLGSEIQPGASASFVDGCGTIEHVIEDACRLCDAVIFSSPSERHRKELRACLDAVLGPGGAPVFYFPSGASPRIGQHVSIAYDGSAAAARSLKAALPILCKAGAIHVTGLRGIRREPAQHVQDVRSFLALHGLKLSSETCYEAPAAQNAIEAAKARGSDLLVIGGYRQKTMREWFSGDAADQYFDSAKSMAVFTAH